jgi:hypothetical protein
MGEAKTVNKGFKLAKGQIICVVSSDYPLLPKAISSAVDFFHQHPDVSIVYPDWQMINLKGKKIKQIKTFDYSYSNMLRWHHCMPGPGTFINKEVITTLKGRDPKFKYVGDFEFWLRAGLKFNFARIPKTLSLYRFHPGSATLSDAGKKMADEHIKLVEKIYTLPNLSLEIRCLKREAFSSAHYVAAASCGQGQTLLKIKHVLLAFYFQPWKYMGEYRNRTKLILGEVLKKRSTDE